MKALRYGIVIALALFVLPAMAIGEEDTTTYSLWLGGHYTDFTDNGKKVGEYNLGNSEGMPEALFKSLFRSDGKLLELDGHYYDDQNITARLNALVDNRLKLQVGYRSLVRQLQQDLLMNMDAKEAIGGKILSHDLQDSGADYNYNRHEITSSLELLLSEKNDIRFRAAHRSILKKGDMQALSSNHCWGCHVVSQTAAVDRRTHAVNAGIDAEIQETNVGYEFDYRRFDSYAAEPMRYYDTASHPIDYTNPGTAAEFGSRLIYDDTTLANNTLPETEKMTHKVRFKRDFGKSNLASAISYSTVENKNTELSSDAIAGVVNFSALLSTRSRLLVRGRTSKVTNDDPFISIPIYRDGRPGPDASRPDFSFTRYSSLDRWDSELSLELVHRLNRRWNLSLLAGYRLIDRDDYLMVDDGLTTKRMFGQAKVRFRANGGHSGWLKYRFEKTTDPYISGRGLFESNGNVDLARDWAGAGNTFAFIFYFDRESLRYQTITTEPTDRHDVQLTGTFRAAPRVTINAGLRGMYDKNGDLDSLDVKHLSAQPSLGLTVAASKEWSFSSGYSYQFAKSRGPVTVALFDG